MYDTSKLRKISGLVGYETYDGKTWHWKLRQARNYYFPQMAKTWA